MLGYHRAEKQNLINDGSTDTSTRPVSSSFKPAQRDATTADNLESTSRLWTVVGSWRSMQTLNSVRLPPSTQESNHGSLCTEAVLQTTVPMFCPWFQHNINEADYNYSSPSQSVSSNSSVCDAKFSDESHLVSALWQTSSIKTIVVRETKNLFPAHSLIFPDSTEKRHFTCKCQCVNHWRPEEWIPHVFGFEEGKEKSEHVTLEDGNREEEIKSVLSALSRSSMPQIMSTS